MAAGPQVLLKGEAHVQLLSTCRVMVASNKGTNSEQKEESGSAITVCHALHCVLGRGSRRACMV